MKNQKQIIIKNIVAFLVLMESDGGVMGTSPDYILEKFQRYCLSEHPDEWQWGLDLRNRLKLSKWVKI